MIEVEVILECFIEYLDQNYPEVQLYNKIKMGIKANIKQHIIGIDSSFEHYKM